MNPPHIPAARPHDRGLLGLLLIVAVFVALQALILAAIGHPWICTCGRVELWHANPSGPETSQHLTDWYTYTHVIHGVGFYLLLWLIAPRLSFGLRFAFTIGLEAAWEVVENTPVIMDRYRESALARGYFGDSVVNSIFDTFAAALGFVLARNPAGVVDRRTHRPARIVSRLHDPRQSHAQYHSTHLPARGDLALADRRLSPKRLHILPG